MVQVLESGAGPMRARRGQAFMRPWLLPVVLRFAGS
jgi:hypothetical protein